jgi:hypothetical protein
MRCCMLYSRYIRCLKYSFYSVRFCRNEWKDCFELLQFVNEIHNFTNTISLSPMCYNICLSYFVFTIDIICFAIDAKLLNQQRINCRKVSKAKCSLNGSHSINLCNKWNTVLCVTKWTEIVF